MVRKYAALPILVMALFGAGRARADINLVNLTNPPIQTNTPYTFVLTANGAAIDLAFEGYQLPSFEQVTDISLTTGGGPNLLGQIWTYTPAANGALASQFNDGYGTGTNALNFGGLVVGDYDKFDQSIPTTVGQNYTLHFLFSEDFTGPSGFLAVSSAPVPEPTGVILLLAMLLVVGVVAQKRAAQLESTLRVRRGNLG